MIFCWLRQKRLGAGIESRVYALAFTKNWWGKVRVDDLAGCRYLPWADSPRGSPSVCPFPASDRLRWGRRPDKAPYRTWRFPTARRRRPRRRIWWRTCCRLSPPGQSIWSEISRLEERAREEMKTEEGYSAISVIRKSLEKDGATDGRTVGQGLLWWCVVTSQKCSKGQNSMKQRR